jgi:hypothetical protein
MSTEQQGEEEVIAIELDDNGNPVGDDEGGAGGDQDDDENDDDGGSDDRRLNASDEDDDDDGEQDDPNESSASRKRRMRRRDAQRRARAENERETRMLREQNQMLEQRLATLEGRTVADEDQQLARRLQQVQSDARLAEEIMGKAMAAGNGADHTQAMNLRDSARAEEYQLRQRLAARQQQRTAAPGVNPLVQNHAQEWLAANSWYDPQGGDEHSAIVNQIDVEMTQQGYDPRTSAYWEELSDRASARIREAEGTAEPAQNRQGRRGPPVGTTRNHAGQSTRQEVYVTPARKAAMKEAGIWDDPTLRARALREYRDFDANNSAR